jgi:hypothetical protein
MRACRGTDLFMLVQSRLHVLVIAKFDVSEVLGFVVSVEGDFGSSDLYNIVQESISSFASRAVCHVFLTLARIASSQTVLSIS